MVYEDDAFLDACDARGVLLWQDFMFANMDYPEDEALRPTVRRRGPRAGRALARPAVARRRVRVERGRAAGGDVGRAARAVVAAAAARDPAGRVAEACPDAAYWPSSAHGGAFPHAATEGTTSYYGVGAYLRPLDDARRAEVRFASECLAFANVPGAAGLAETAGRARRARPPPRAGRRGTPRDLGAGWDFDDVRDHYVARAVRRRSDRAALGRPRPLPRARPDRDRRGHGGDLRRVAARALDLRRRPDSGSSAICGPAPAGA